jgi:glutamate/tyrosine decarboxylase-like PLP-dependent enzyme
MNHDHPVHRILKSVSLDGPGTEVMGSWFHGPAGENEALLERLLSLVIADHSVVRKTLFPDDPPWIDTTTPDYKRASNHIERQLQALMRRLSKYSIPWYSYRYHAHMNWDVSLPSLAGYVAAVLYNQNNVAGEGSPVTTALEMEVAADLCRMIGFSHDGGATDLEPWGHLTSGGTVANTEAMWAYRNLKLYPFTVQQALKHAKAEDPTLDVESVSVRATGQEDQRSLTSLNGWEVLNLTADTTLSLPTQLKQRFDKQQHSRVTRLIDEHSLQRLGLARFTREFQRAHNGDRAIDSLAFLAPVSCHYSIPKAITLLGLGAENLIFVQFDSHARMSIPHLRVILDQRRRDRQPVAAIVAVFGTTQEGAVDPLSQILEVRDDYREQGLDFAVHVDAAWGGYFASLLRSPHPDSHAARVLASARPARGPHLAQQQLSAQRSSTRAHEELVFTPEMGLSKYVHEQLSVLWKADSVTLDPHKSGFAPYPAGALCYRRKEIPEMVQYTAPIVFHDGRAPTVGVYGIEGSKPGAAAAAVWLSHRIIRPDQSGYGRILGRCLFNANRLIGAIATLESERFVLKTLQPLRSGEMELLRELYGLHNEELWARLEQDPKAERLFLSFGSDLVINTYAVNLRLDDEHNTTNRDPLVANALNDRVFRRLSLEYEGDEWPGMMLTSSEYDPKVTGRAFVDRFRESLGVERSDEPMRYLLSTTANPWLTDADGGTVNMIPVIVEQLRATIDEEAMRLRRDIKEGVWRP